ncbi:hypothetical protein [Clostridium gasigenes]|uniref:hypothetical protein n=1 Tax=Clostridium gasigenes TaxID=94869 RepID=UPI001C0E342C|nr:hypothetical protein [Clostridium gasigenes]MBU3102688.1 hypothetical protein [Clostridium gasigenes]
MLRNGTIALIPGIFVGLLMFTPLIISTVIHKKYKSHIDKLVTLTNDLNSLIGLIYILI